MLKMSNQGFESKTWSSVGAEAEQGVGSWLKIIL